MECPNSRGCAMYPLLTLSATLKTWQIRYCNGDFAACERYKRGLQGIPVPPELMPNGVLLKKAPGAK